jgi:hypothetical protein
VGGIRIVAVSSGTRWAAGCGGGGTGAGIGAGDVEGGGRTNAAGKSGNPAGRPWKHISDLSRECRRYSGLALSTIIDIIKTGTERNRLAAALALWDRGYGKPLQAIDLLTAGKKFSEMSDDELANVDARVMSLPGDDEAKSDLFH